MSVYEAIESLSSEYSVHQICRALGISQSSYSYWLNNGRQNRDKAVELYQKIIEVYYSFNGIYGAGKIANELNKMGMKYSVSKVSRAMRLLGIKSIVSSKFPKRKNHIKVDEKRLIVNLIKGIKLTRVNQVWTTDITYIKTKSGTFYLISFIDQYSKTVVAWDLRKRQTSDDVMEVLDKAVKSRKPVPGLIIHSDKGSQMRSSKYREYLKKHNFVFSYTSLHHSCDENSAQESFHSLLKRECIYQAQPTDFVDAFLKIRWYIDEFYNTVRSHSALEYLSPFQFELLHFPLTTPSNI